MGTNRTLIASQGVTSPSVARSRVMHVSELCYTNNHRIMGMSMDDCIRSCHTIPQLTGSYRMKIYERENFGGQMHELSDDCDSIMERYRMSDCQSCNVMDGHWLMYEQANYRGRMMYMRPGEYRSFRDMGVNNKH